MFIETSPTWLVLSCFFIILFIIVAFRIHFTLLAHNVALTMLAMSINNTAKQERDDCIVLVLQ